jgi:hypothetical protein
LLSRTISIARWASRVVNSGCVSKRVKAPDALARMLTAPDGHRRPRRLPAPPRPQDRRHDDALRPPRDRVWLAPGLLVRAPEYSGAGTGKGLLVRAICAVAFGARPVAITAGATAEEFDKRITAALMEAGATLFLDNVNSTALKSDVLASAITERPAAVRPLGRSATVQLNPTAFVAVTGNGLLLSEDMARRFLTVELDAGMEDPEARDFRTDFLADTLAAREALLRDALTIWRRGRQQGDALPAGRALGSFTAWARWCRDPLVALGGKDPALRVADAKAKDPRRQNVAELFAAWWKAHGDRAVAVADLAEPVRVAADPMGRGRQYLAAKVRALDGTRAAGFVLTRVPAEGKWSPDRYTLRRAPAERGADHGEHRGHRGGAAGSPGDTTASGGAAASDAPDHRGEHRGHRREGMGASSPAANPRHTPMPPMTPMPSAGAGPAEAPAPDGWSAEL